jgi:hypothetical protein
MKRSLLLCLLYCLGFFGARAQLRVDSSPAVPQGDGTFAWSYEARLAPGYLLRSNDYFVIFDFGHVVSAVPQAGWELSTSLQTPAGILPPADHPWIANVGFQYLGPTVTGPAAVGAFTIISTNSQGGFGGQYASSTGVERLLTPSPYLAEVNLGYLHSPSYLLRAISGGVPDGNRLLSGVTITLPQLDLTSGQPIGTNVLHTTTDTNGLYSFPNLPSGFRYRLEASKPGYTFFTSPMSMVISFSDELLSFPATRTEAPGLNIRLSWPASDTGFSVQSKDALGASNTWTAMSQSSSMANI